MARVPATLSNGMARGTTGSSPRVFDSGVPLVLGAVSALVGGVLAVETRRASGSRGVQLSLPLPRARTDEYGRALPAAFWRWFGNSDAVDDQGRPMVFWHGSEEEGFDTFDVQNKSYGYFFAHDKETARYYGPHLYEVYLKAENIADFDDDETFYKVAREAVDSDKLERHESTDWGWNPVESRDFRKKLAEEIREALGNEGTSKRTSKAWAWWRATLKTLKDLTPGERRALLAGDSVAIAETVEYESWEDGDDVVEAFWKAVPKRKVAFDREYPLLNADIEWARRSYGDQDFYMNHQDDFLHAAENMGYDAVIMTDPSSTGESTSWVMFDPKRIKLVKNRGTFDAEDARMSFNRTARKSGR